MRVAFDIGGTFTDVITLGADGALQSAKVLSLHDRLGGDISARVDGHRPAEPVERFVHATTICSNAVIEGTVARAGLITTAGFRDTLELRNQKGPQNPSIAWRPPQPLVPRQRCVEVDERIRADGSVDRVLDEAGARAAIRRLLDQDVEAIAVCLLNAYLNPAHERRLGEMIREIAPGLPFCLSCDVHPEVREYERTSTTVINAALLPVVGRYLDGLQAHLSRHSPQLHIMQSNGGIMSAAAARVRPMFMVESGPAAGVLAAARLAAEMGIGEVLSFDMGGTTAKACLIQDARPLERSSVEIGAASTAGGRARESGHALKVPTFDLVEVGAGGGSIAWTDGASLRVGPRSAGADPGPVCYARGGTAPTVTDANVVLGYINPAAIADGTVNLDAPAARAAFDTLAARLGMQALPLAYGVTQVANAVMMRALRAVSTERGHDPRRATLVAFGGAGPLHAAALAQTLGIETVVVPPLPGVFSALGLLLADYRLDYVASMVSTLDGVDVGEVYRRFESLEATAREDMARLGMPVDRLRFERVADLKLSYQVEDVPFPVEPGRREDLAAVLSRAFDEHHEREYGFVAQGTRMLVNLRVRAIAPADTLRFDALAPAGGAARATAAPVRRQAYFGPAHGTLDTLVTTRSGIAGVVPGPVIIEEPDTTAVVPPGWSVEMHPNAALVLRRMPAQGGTPQP
ncbi:MAG: hydantoinase/oxoprolinase family protein [Gammaproteobacteria bacterium]